jgi:hypothetical protein
MGMRPRQSECRAGVVMVGATLFYTAGRLPLVNRLDFSKNERVCSALQRARKLSYCFRRMASAQIIRVGGT